MLLSSFYNQLFFTSNPSNIDICLSHLQPVIYESMNDYLLIDITEIEVKAVVFQMNALEAPSLDGFLTYFFQKN